MRDLFEEKPSAADNQCASPMSPAQYEVKLGGSRRLWDRDIWERPVGYLILNKCHGYLASEKLGVRPRKFPPNKDDNEQNL